MSKFIPQSSFHHLITKGIFVIFACLGTITSNAEEVAKSKGDAARGAITWSQNCARCHEMRDPMEFRDDQWRPIVSHMRLRASLTGQQQRDILAFLQSSNNPKPSKSSSAIVTEKNSGPVLSGKEIYNKTCIACHGADGTGALPGVPDLTKPDGVLVKSDSDLLENISNGFQSPGSSMSMPAKGGNPNLTEANIKAVLEFLRERFIK